MARDKKQDAKDRRRRRTHLRRTTELIRQKTERIVGDNLRQVLDIPEDEWEAAQAEDIEEALREVKDWQGRVDDLSKVGKLVHLAARMDSVDLESIRAELLVLRVAAYEDEISIQAGRVGCGKAGALTNGSIISLLNDECIQDAQSIVATFNYDLAREIEAIRDETPRANRRTYASRLRDWNTERATKKNPQIAQYTEGTARAQAQADFYAFNDNLGVAVLEPTDAVCPVCQGWIERGEVPISVATEDPPPYHVGCPHYFEIYADKVAKEDCLDLWVGGA